MRRLERKWEVQSSEARSARRTWKPLDKEVSTTIAVPTVAVDDADTGDVVDLVAVAVGHTEEAVSLRKPRRPVRPLQLLKPTILDGLLNSENLHMNAE